MQINYWLPQNGKLLGLDNRKNKIWKVEIFKANSRCNKWVWLSKCRDEKDKQKILWEYKRIRGWVFDTCKKCGDIKQRGPWKISFVVIISFQACLVLWGTGQDAQESENKFTGPSI